MGDVMSKKQKPNRVLKVKRDVIRRLSPIDLKAVNGGGSTPHPTKTTSR
jgi:hypothetical protein